MACPVYLPKELFLLSRARVQEQNAIAANLREGKHLSNRIGNGIKRPLANPRSAEPVVFDEMNYRRLVGHGVINEVLPRPGRNHYQG